VKNPKSYRCSLYVIACIALAATVHPVARSRATDPTEASDQPNILFIMADDLGYGDVGCYGQRLIQTPNIDRLAAEGMRFRQAYAGSTVCAPSRCSLMTGYHNGHNRVRDNIPHGVFLHDSDVTLAEVLHGAGYRTGAVGKWSLGVHGSEGKPNDQGFDDWFGHLDQDQAHFYYPHYLWDNDRIRLLAGNRGERKQEYTHDLFTERAMQFIAESADGPFFLYLAYTIPHFSDYPNTSSMWYIVPSDAPYGDRPWPQIERNYAAMITRMDRDVGRIMNQLRELDLDRRTLVIFTSDNGPYGGSGAHELEFFDSNGPLRGAKRDLYEGGIRVPFIARWPGQVPAGTSSDERIAFWDMLPTLAEAAGAEPPPGIDGLSMLAALRGEAPPVRHPYLYWDYGHVRGAAFGQAVRFGNWKAIRRGSLAGPIELFDLAADESETTDVAGEHPKVVSEAEQFMDEAFVESEAYPVGGTR